MRTMVLSLRGMLALAAGMGALGALAQPAAAQQVCIGSPRNVPRFQGVPRWFTTDPAASDFGQLLNDPRWANAARTPHQGDSSNASFRVAYDNGYLLVSFETEQKDTPDDTDAVYLGISAGITANAVKIKLPPVDGAVPNNAPRDYLTNGRLMFQTMTAADTSRVTDTAGWSVGAPDAAKPAWIEFPGAWVRQVGNGWGINLKINLAMLGSAYTAGNTLRLFFGAMVYNAGTGTFYHSPQPTGTTVLNEFGNNPIIPRRVSEWLTTAQPVGTSCEGISLAKSTIGITLPEDGYRELDSFMPRTVDLRARLRATPVRPNPAYDAVNNPDVPLTVAIDDLTIAAKFRIADWGTQATLDVWNPLTHVMPGSSPPVEVPSVGGIGGALELHCKANTATHACSVELARLKPSSDPDKSHQCMLVEMSKTTTNPAVQFAGASEYTNLTFDIASTVERVATINVKGLQAKLKNSNARDVYLFVERANMPKAGKTLLPELPRSEMARLRLAASGEASCRNPDESCQAHCDSEVCEGYACAWECNPYDYDPCGNDRRLDVDGCFCVDYEVFDACLPDDVVNPEGADAPAGSEEQLLARAWPYYHVRAFYDTGKRSVIKGASRPILAPMPDFGLFIDHTGAYYGWSDTLQLLTTSGVTWTAVAPDVYRVRIPNEGKAEVLVQVTAHDRPVDVPLCTLSGAASNFGLFGSIDMVQLSQSNQPFNLSRASARIDELLYEPNNRELATNIGAPTTLTRQWGATPGAATFTKSGLLGPSIRLEVLELPLIGRLMTTSVSNVNVARPASCDLLGGSAWLETKFTFKDGVNPDLVTSGQDDWACAPFSMFDL